MERGRLLRRNLKSEGWQGKEKMRKTDKAYNENQKTEGEGILIHNRVSRAHGN